MSFSAGEASFVDAAAAVSAYTLAMSLADPGLLPTRGGARGLGGGEADAATDRVYTSVMSRLGLLLLVASGSFLSALLLLIMLCWQACVYIRVRLARSWLDGLGVRMRGLSAIGTSIRLDVCLT